MIFLRLNKKEEGHPTFSAMNLKKKKEMEKQINK